METFLQENSELKGFVLSNVNLTGTTIGRGSYGSVEEVAIRGAVCAAKTIHGFFLDPSIVRSVDIQKASTQFVKECQLMSTLRHPNIVQFLGICEVPGSRLPALVMERLATCLHDVLDPDIDPPPPADAPKPFFPLYLKCSILHDVAITLFTLSQTFPCDLLAPTYRKEFRHIARTELERRDEYIQIVYQEFGKRHPLSKMIEQCLDFPENRPSILDIVGQLELVTKDCRDKKPNMNTLELVQALEVETKKKVRAIRAVFLYDPMAG